MTKRLAFALAALIAASSAAAATQLSTAAFTAQTSNPSNLFQAATSFENLRVASGSYTGNAADGRSITGAGFQPDLVIVKGNTTQVAVARTSTMSGDSSKPLVGATPLQSDRIQSLEPNGFTIGTDAQVNSSGVTYNWTAFKAAAGELRLGTYTGNGTSQSIGGVGFSPEYVAVLGAGANNATQRFSGMTRAFRFDAATGQTTAITSLDADGFSVGSSIDANASGTTYDYLAFNDVAGRVRTGTYTGDATDNRAIGGVGFQPQYVLVRANDTATARRALARPQALTGDSTLRFDAMFNGSNRIQALQADGFQVGTDGDVNATGVTYHYLAVKNPGSCANPGSQTVQPTADAYVDQASPSSNFGTSSDLFVTSKSGSANRRTLVRFNLPAVPSGCSVTGASLNLYSTSAVTGRTIGAYRAGGSWTETGVTWNNAPAPTGAGVTGPSGTGWRTWDVTSQVQAMYSPGPNDGFVIRDESEGDPASPEQKYQSRDGTPDGQDPELVVTFG
jgi:hypothetical protein